MFYVKWRGSTVSTFLPAVNKIAPMKVIELTGPDELSNDGGGGGANTSGGSSNLQPSNKNR
jgi:hypothetical protein